MACAAVICEYNPFHNGHARQITAIRRLLGEDTAIAAVMCGSFVQRGEAAIFDKYTRARAAVMCGADLVVELPPPWSFDCAQRFARAGVTVAEALGASHLCFGSECVNLGTLKLIASRVGSSEFDAALGAAVRANVRGGESFIRLRGEVYQKLYGEELAPGPNDILGIEYLRAIAENTSGHPLIPVAIPREGTECASEARRYIIKRDFGPLSEIVPQNVLPLYQTLRTFSLGTASPAILDRLRNGRFDFDRVCGAGGGIGKRIAGCAESAGSYEELCAAAATKKYTGARIQRAILCLLLGVAEEMAERTPRYSVVLAANAKGRSILADRTSDFPLVTRPAAAKRLLTGEALEQWRFAETCDRFFALCVSPALPGGWYLTQTPYMK